MADTVRSRIDEIRREVLETADLVPTRASELETKLAALLGNVTTEVRESELTYKAVLLGCLKSAEKANRARIEAETTPAYARYREAKDTHAVTVEMIRSLRAYLRNAAEEMRLSR